MHRERTAAGLAVGALLAVAALELVLAARWDLLADEAYYAAWAERPALGYYDQPPLIAWVLWGVRTLVDGSDLAIRVPAILAGVVAPCVLIGAVRDRALWVAWWVGIPALAWLTGFCTPDAFLLMAWTVALAAAHRGGRLWWVAGVAVGVAILAKYTAVLLLPLLWMATGDWKDRNAWVGAGLAAVVIAPHAAWLATHEGVSVAFQMREGLVHPDPPGLVGPLAAVGQQLGVATPFAVLAALGVWIRRPRTRLERIAWWTSAPVAAFFVLAALGGPPEAHWMAPVWVGVGLLVAASTGWVHRAAWLAVGTGVFGSALLIAHAEVGVFSLRLDPADRIREGRPLAAAVGGWALPLGVAAREPRAVESMPVHTERYQEAALIWWYTGIPAVAHPDCARADQYDLWADDAPPPDDLLFVRPTRSGDALCTDDTHPDKTRHSLVPRDSEGRIVGRWDLFEVHR